MVISLFLCVSLGLSISFSLVSFFLSSGFFFPLVFHPFSRKMFLAFFSFFLVVFVSFSRQCVSLSLFTFSFFFSPRPSFFPATTVMNLPNPLFIPLSLSPLFALRNPNLLVSRGNLPPCYYHVPLFGFIIAPSPFLPFHTLCFIFFVSFYSSSVCNSATVSVFVFVTVCLSFLSLFYFFLSSLFPHTTFLHRSPPFFRLLLLTSADLGCRSLSLLS